MAPGTFLIIGYIATIAIEGPILWFGLSSQHTAPTRIMAAVWLTACTYPIVVLVIPSFGFAQSRLAYLVVAESLAVVGECVLFVAAFPADAVGARIRDTLVVALANITSFLAGEAWWYLHA